MSQYYRFVYDSGVGITEWCKTLDELLVPNGNESLLVWMLREADARGGYVRLELIEPFDRELSS